MGEAEPGSSIPLAGWRTGFSLSALDCASCRSDPLCARFGALDFTVANGNLRRPYHAAYSARGVHLLPPTTHHLPPPHPPQGFSCPEPIVARSSELTRCRMRHGEPVQAPSWRTSLEDVFPAGRVDDFVGAKGRGAMPILPRISGPFPCWHCNISRPLELAWLWNGRILAWRNYQDRAVRFVVLSASSASQTAALRLRVDEHHSQTKGTTGCRFQASIFKSTSTLSCNRRARHPITSHAVAATRQDTCLLQDHPLSPVHFSRYAVSWLPISRLFANSG